MSNLNKPPSWFPAAWHVIVKDGKGQIPTQYYNLEEEWVAAAYSPKSLRKRFQAFIKALRLHPLHKLHNQAVTRAWSIAEEDGKLTVTSRPRTEEEFHRWKRANSLNRRY